MKKKFLVFACLTALVLSCGNSLFAVTKLFDATAVKGKWQATVDKTPAAKLTVVDGPKGQKALQLDYKFDEGIWIALVKNTNFALTDKDKIHFTYKGSGASVNLKLKINDSSGGVFGYTIGSTVTSDWTEITIPVSEMTYLWGGVDADSFKWDKLKKLEFTLDTPESGGDYPIDKDPPGKLFISRIEIIK
jgi:hypothetical protein